MRSGSLAAKRSLARRGLLAALFAVGLVTTALLSGITGYLSASGVTGTRTVLEQTPARDAALQLQTPLAEESAERTEQLESTAALLDERLQGTHTAVWRTVRIDPLPFTRVSPGQAEVLPTDTESIVVGTDLQLADWATLVDGEWAGDSAGDGVVDKDGAAGKTDAPVPAMLHAAAAEALGLAPGDIVEVGTAPAAIRAVIVGTWLPRNAAAAYWFGDPLAASGHTQGAPGTNAAGKRAAGTLIVSDETVGPLAKQAAALWTMAPDTATFLPGDLPALARAIPSLNELTDDDTVTSSGSASITGGLAATATRLQQSLGAVQGVAAVPVLLVATIGLITLAQLARLLIATRSTESALIRARGASVAGLTRFATVEAFVVLLPAAAIGATLASLVLAAFGATPSAFGQTDAVAGWPFVVGVVVCGVAVCALVALRGAVLAGGPGRGEDSGRAGQAATVGVFVLVAGAAGLSLWQFLLYRSPLAASPDGSLHIDPLAVFAPALAMIALAMIALLAFGPLLAIVQALAATSRSLSVVLPSRQVGRRVAVFAVAVLLVTLSVGGTTVAAAYAGTWSALDASAAMMRNGSDVRVDVESARSVAGPDTIISAAPYAALDGVSAAAPVLITPVTVGADDVSLTAIAREALPAVVSEQGDALNPDRLAAELGTAQVGTELPAEATTVSITVAAPGATGPGTVSTAVWVTDAGGAVARLPFGAAPLADLGTTPITLQADLPNGTAPWRILALESTLAESDGATGVRIEFSDTGAGQTESPVGPRFETVLAWDKPTGRVLLGSADSAENTTTDAQAEPLTVVLTDALAARLDANVGDTLAFLIPTTGTSVDAIVGGTTALVPGSTGAYGILTDLPALSEYALGAGERVPQPQEVWIRAEDAASVAQTASQIPDLPARVTTIASQSTSAMLGPVVTALHWGMAGALLLAAIAVLAITVTLAATRRGEVMVLRALGVSDGEQARLRLVELATVVAASFLLGILSGLIVSWLTVGILARTAVAGLSDAIPAPLQPDWTQLSVLAGSFLLALAAIATAYAARVRRQAQDTTAREETR